MEAGVAVAAGPRGSSFRKPSHDTSQRNYRRRSPSSSSTSSSSRSSSASPPPPPPPPGPSAAPSGGWKRDRSASPSSPRRDGTSHASLHSKKGKTVHAKYDSDDSPRGRPGEHGPGSSEHQARGGSYERHGKSGPYDSRRSAVSHHDRNFQGHSRHSDSLSDRRNGGYDQSLRNRQSPDRGYRESWSGDKERIRSRDRDRDFEGITRSRSGGREKDVDMEAKVEQDRSKDRHRDRDRDRDRDRERDLSRGRQAGRDLYGEKDRDLERRYERGRSRDSIRDRERERIRSRHTARESTIGKDFEAGEIDDDRRREKDREMDQDKRKEKTKLQSKSGVRDFSSPKNLGRESREWSADNETQMENRDRNRGGFKDRDSERAEGKGIRELSIADVDREKDAGRSRDKGKSKDIDPPRDRDDLKGQDRRRDCDREGDEDDSYRSRDFKNKEELKDNPRLKDRDDQKEPSKHKDKEDIKVLDRLREKDDLGPDRESHRSSIRHDSERSGSKVIEMSERRSLRDRERGNDRRSSDGPREKDKSLNSIIVSERTVKLEKEKQHGARVKEVEENYKSEPRDGEGKNDRNLGIRGQEGMQQTSGLFTVASDSDKKVSATSTLDGKATKGSKWGPESSDSTMTVSANEELANDLTAAKLAAMKAAELVNKNLGVSGFMSADQKKRLLWGNKKLAAEQEPAVAAGSNRWDTVHFSDPDRQEKFHKLMGVKADASTECKKDGDTDAGIFTEERQRELQQDLEKQFAAGLRRRDGGKVGLGL